MNIKLEPLKKHIIDIIDAQICDFDIDVGKIADTTAVSVLSEIQSIISDEKNSDFDAVEKIVCVFEKYHLDFGGRHDF
ncbi:MAG: hypothetical protein J5590_03815 [Clostridia bacterium]|nr:hypothetical protein [Clostridia bacterium]